MSLNRYSSLPKINIRNNQHLTDLNIYDNTLAKKQLSYDTTVANTENALKQASQLTGTGNAASAYVAKINEDLKNQVGQYSGQDLGSAKVKGDLHSIISTAASDSKLKEIQAVNAHKAELDKKYAAMEANGELAPSQAYFYKKGWDNYGQTMDSSVVPQTVMKAADLTSERKKLFSDIKASGSDQIKMMGDLAYKTSSKGVDIGRLNKAAQNQLSTYANSHAGRQEKMDFDMGIETGAIPKGTDFNQYLLKNIMSTGENFAYSDFSTNQDGIINKKRDEDVKKKEEEAYAGSGFLPAMATGKQLDVDSDGMINVNPILDGLQYLTGYEPRTKEELTKQKDLQDRAAKAGVTPQVFAEKLNADPNVKVDYYNSAKADKISKQFFNPTTGGGDFWTRIVKNTEYPQGISVAELMKIKDLSKEDLKNGFTVIGDVAPDNPYTPKGMATMIGGEYFIIDDRHSNKDLNAEYYHALNQAKYNENGEHTQVIRNPADGKLVRLTSRFDGTNAVPVNVEEVKEEQQ